MDNWLINKLNDQGIPNIIKIIHLGDFIQLVYEDGRVFGGFITNISLEGPTPNENNNIHIISINTTNSTQEDEKILWASKIKQFRIIHK